MQRDPRDRFGQHYLYGQNNPVRMVDPMGLDDVVLEDGYVKYKIENDGTLWDSVVKNFVIGRIEDGKANIFSEFGGFNIARGEIEEAANIVDARYSELSGLNSSIQKSYIQDALRQLSEGNKTTFSEHYPVASGAGGGIVGGSNIVVNKFTFGATDALGITSAGDYTGGMYTVARISATASRESLLLAFPVAGTAGRGGKTVNIVAKGVLIRDAAEGGFRIGEGSREIAQGNVARGGFTIATGALQAGGSIAFANAIKNPVDRSLVHFTDEASASVIKSSGTFDRTKGVYALDEGAENLGISGRMAQTGLSRNKVGSFVRINNISNLSSQNFRRTFSIMQNVQGVRFSPGTGVQFLKSTTPLERLEMFLQVGTRTSDSELP